MKCTIQVVAYTPVTLVQALQQQAGGPSIPKITGEKGRH